MYTFFRFAICCLSLDGRSRKTRKLLPLSRSRAGNGLLTTTRRALLGRYAFNLKSNQNSAVSNNLTKRGKRNFLTYTPHPAKFRGPRCELTLCALFRRFSMTNSLRAIFLLSIFFIRTTLAQLLVTEEQPNGTSFRYIGLLKIFPLYDR